jgi:hypothetical protein
MPFGFKDLLPQSIQAMLLSSSTILDALLLVVFVYLLKRFLTRSPQTRSLPGPKGLPLIGNALDLPKEYEWETFTRWGKEFGMRACDAYLHFA